MEKFMRWTRLSHDTPWHCYITYGQKMYLQRVIYNLKYASWEAQGVKTNRKNNALNTFFPWYPMTLSHHMWAGDLNIAADLPRKKKKNKWKKSTNITPWYRMALSHHIWAGDVHTVEDLQHQKCNLGGSRCQKQWKTNALNTIIPWYPMALSHHIWAGDVHTAEDLHAQKCKLV